MDTHRTFWLRRARREALRFNFGWWVQFFLPWVFGIGVLASVCVLGLRTANHGLLALSVAVPLLVVAGIAVSFFLARRRFLTVSEALTRLDADLGLHTRLSSAHQGIGEWPVPRAGARLSLGWNWTSLLKPPLVAGALVAACLLVPVPKGQSKPGAIANPPSWDAIQSRLEALGNSEIVQTEALEELRRSLDSLRNQPPDQWFGHASLEASDQLDQQIEQAAGLLGERLEAALSVMEAARRIPAHQLQAVATPLDNALAQTIQAMELGALPLNEQTLSQLKGLDASKLRQLSSEQWKSLTDRLKVGIGAGPTGNSSAGKGRQAARASILGDGTGEVERGPGPSPLMLKPDETQLGTTSTEAVQNDDLSRAALGDLTGLSMGEPEADKATWTPGQSGGSNVSAGTGCEAVWGQLATPAEQEALRRFFK
jgi:hypothetical protein